ncbi:MAG: hypothetical protein ACRDNM_03930 [Gaiellaceae bacterium]
MRVGLVALVALALLAAGCGGGVKSPVVASVGTTTSHRSTGATNGKGGGDFLLAYSKCMRANGVPAFPDPSPGGGFEFQTGAGIDPSSPAFKAAQAKCMKLLPGGGPPAPGTRTHPTDQWLAQMIKAAECMRRHGISAFPDPTTTVPPLPAGGGLISDIEGAIFAFPSTFDTQSPAFVRAANACGFPLHNH